MSVFKRTFGFHFSRIAVLLALLAVSIGVLSAQDTQGNDRIVDGRPPLYKFKHVIDPFTWFEWGTEPVFRSAESGLVHRRVARLSEPEKPKTSGVRFGLGDVGAGSGFGPQVTFFHKDLLGRGIDVEVPLVYTYHRYEAYQFTATVPIYSQSFVNKLTFDIGTGYRSRARDDMFTIGNDAPLHLESQIRTVTRSATAGFSTELNARWKAGVHETYRNVGVTEPLLDKNAQEVLRPFEIPGLASGAELRSTVLTIEHDTEDKHFATSSGGRETAEVSLHDSVGNGNFVYWRYRLAVEHSFPLSKDRRAVLSFRGLAETNQNKSGRSVPWFDMPALGTWETLRGFENFRFRDKSALALTAEYRYRIWRMMDWAFFVDAGQVAPWPRDFGFDRFHAGYGARLFVYPKSTFPISIDLAHSDEKRARLYINFNTTF
jgi:hypothetical protein